MAVMNKLDDKSPLESKRPWTKQVGVLIKMPPRWIQVMLRRKAAPWCMSAMMRLKTRMRNWLGGLFPAALRRWAFWPCTALDD